MLTPNPTNAPTGYQHPRYARSLQEFGLPLELQECRGWIIERPIQGTADHDAMGCYPLFTCQDWSRVHLDVEALQDRLVSITLVTDPFGNYDETYLRRSFPDLAIPFKEHYVVDLEKPRDQISRGHRKEARRALRHLSVQVHPNPPEFLDVWMDLHRHLITKHHVTGIAAFSRAAFAEQLATPGMVVLYASCGTEPVAATLYSVQGEVAHGHVLGCTAVGYQHRALYALFWSAIEFFTGSLRWINLMGVPGAQDAGSEGMRHFKQGWTTETRTAWLCGRILNSKRYAEIVKATGTSHTRYFPAYRDGEMARSNPERPVEGI